MKLLTIADSFTYGEELANKESAWPCQLGKMLGYEVSNLGQPGSGNTQMIRKAVEHVGEYDLIVIAWSHYARIELADENGIYDIWPGSNLAVHTALPYRKEMVSYITKYHNDLYFYQQYLVGILLLQGYLTLHKQRYLMVNSFGNNWNDFKDYTQIKKLAAQINTKHFIGWPMHQMVEWTYGCAQGPGGHFLEDGHRIVAEKINEHIRHLGWVS
jgi:hypothetical protein